MEDVDIEEFELTFIMDLDSWFSADIACCDKCHEDFVETWPNVPLRSKSFNPVPLDAFYDGSKRLKMRYTKAEYQNSIEHLRCPRCDRSLKNNCMYPFEFDFDEPNDFTMRSYELQEQIRETPFVALKNKLAAETFDILEKLFLATEPKSFDNKLFRGRVIQASAVQKSSFLPPPKNVTKDGRYNHTGIPVIYAANNEDTCFNELRKPDEDFWLCEFEIKEELKILDLNEIDDFTEEGNLLQAIVWSSLASSKTDDTNWHKPEYYFTRFISDCCKHLGFDGINYPSVQVGSGNNHVLFNTDLLTEGNILRYYKYERKASKPLFR